MTERPSTRSRILIISPRRYQMEVWQCAQMEFEDVILAVDDVDMLMPEMKQHPDHFLFRSLHRATHRYLGMHLEMLPRPRPVEVQQDYEMLFVYAHSVEDLKLLDYVEGYRDRCRLKVCVIEELWIENIRKWGYYWIDRLKGFDVVAVAFRETASVLNAERGLNCVWVPGAVDTLRFMPRSPPAPRTIDIFNMGRRSEDTHRALLTLSERECWTYLFDTVVPRGVLHGEHAQHRAQLAALIQRSRYFFANKARVGTQDTGTQEEIGLRYYEGAAAGAVLIGDAPKSESAQILFDWPDAQVEVPYGATQQAIDVIRELEKDPERVSQIRSANIVNCLRRHDWVYRWQRILELTQLQPHEKLLQRVLLLKQLADDLRDPIASDMQESV